jgi:hypothetical protein
MKKDTAVLLFYILYFLWLFTVTYLSFNIPVLNIFTIFVSVFYLLALREKGDIWWFMFAATIPIIISFFSITGWNVNFTTENIKYFPPWLALAWATTIVALRKLYFIINK